MAFCGLTSLAHCEAMKFVLLPLLCLLVTSGALASPQITEIRLAYSPGYVPLPYDVNEFVFRADGNFYWVEGTSEKLVRHRYSLRAGEFQRLAVSLERHHFFDLGATYPTDMEIADVGKVQIEVTRGGKKKGVTDSPGFGKRPDDLWELQTIFLGFASEYTGLKRAPVNAANARPRPAATATPIPVIRGTEKSAN